MPRVTAGAFARSARLLIGNLGRVLAHAAASAWRHSLFTESAGAAFWQTLSLPPLFLALLGSLGYVCPWFGPGVLEDVQHKIITFARQTLSPKLVDEIIRPTMAAMQAHGREGVTSLSFVISLWAGSSAISAFVDSVVNAHEQTELRHPVRQRAFALLIYVTFLASVIFALPLLSVVPDRVGDQLPVWAQSLLHTLSTDLYKPVLFLGATALLVLFYHIALPEPPPWARLIPGAVFAVILFSVGRFCLLWYMNWVTSTGYSYGALAAPIALLLLAFFLGLAVIGGAELNAAAVALWPPQEERSVRGSARRSGRTSPGSAGTPGSQASGPGSP